MTGAFSLEGRVALVTGGNGGLGRGFALALREAAMIAVTGRDPDKNDAVAKELGPDGAVFPLDVRDEAAVERTVTEVVERFGLWGSESPIKCLTSGFGMPRRRVAKTSLDATEASIGL